MALTYDQISAITTKKYMPKLVDNIFNSNGTLQRLRKKSYEKIDGGTSIMQPLNYAAPTAQGWYNGADTLVTTDNDQVTAAEYAWKQLYVNITILRSDELKNSGDSAKLNLVKAKVKIAEKSMEDLLGTGIFSAGTNAKSIVGLGSIISAANTIGGISQSANSWWQTQVDSTTTTLTMGAMQTQWNLQTIGSWSPTVGIATRTIFNAYYALLQPQQRFQDSETAKGGFQSLMFNGLPILPDSHASSSLPLVFLNEDYMHLYVHKDEDMRFEPFAKPINQNLKVAKIYWMGAFGTSNARLQGGFTALTG